MAISAKHTIRAAREDGEDITEALLDQISVLRKELSEITEAVNDYGGHAFSEVQQNAVALAKEVRHQGAVALRQANRQAQAASKAVQENPIPVIAVLGTIALLSALLFTRD